jgi:hypothetical protein
MTAYDSRLCRFDENFWLALFMCVPFLNILMMWFLAFVPWRQPKHPST